MLPFARHHSILGQGTKWRISPKNSGLDGQNVLVYFTEQDKNSPTLSLRLSRPVAIRPISLTVKDFGPEEGGDPPNEGLMSDDSSDASETGFPLISCIRALRELTRFLRHLRHYFTPGSARD